MKYKLIYPKIPNTFNCPLKQCIAFEKYDGTNIHWVFRKNFGWTAYGTRRDRFLLNNNDIKEFELAHPELSGINKLWDIDDRLKNYITSKYTSPEEIIVFTEYFGPNSFAGSHNTKDKKELVIFDIEADNKFIYPEDLIRNFKDFNIARVIYKGKYSGQLVNDIRDGKYNVKEGAVIKGIITNGDIYMAKIKTKAYMELLKNKFQNSWQEYWE